MEYIRLSEALNNTLQSFYFRVSLQNLIVMHLEDHCQVKPSQDWSQRISAISAIQIQYGPLTLVVVQFQLQLRNFFLLLLLSQSFFSDDLIFSRQLSLRCHQLLARWLDPLLCSLDSHSYSWVSQTTSPEQPFQVCTQECAFKSPSTSGWNTLQSSCHRRCRRPERQHPPPTASDGWGVLWHFQLLPSDQKVLRLRFAWIRGRLCLAGIRKDSEAATNSASFSRFGVGAVVRFKSRRLRLAAKWPNCQINE